ncbi:MAG: protease modulator HflC [Phyllobacteriaceae bacterium]|nr:protease modulator HflC [Phyllobacteriaceae bacterium]
MLNRIPLILGVLAGLAFVIYSSVFVISPREQALVLRFGQITRVVTEPGLYFKLPTAVVDTVQFVSKQVRRFDLDDIRVQVRDGRRYIVDAFVAYKIVDARKFRESVSGNIDLLEDNLRTRLDASLRSVYGQRSFEAALSDQRLQMMLAVRDQLRPQAEELGVEIADVRILRTDLLPEVSSQTFERMKAERLAEAAQLRALGNQQAIRIRAEADREAVVTIAEAQRDAEILRGEGEGERNRVFADAFQRDKDFFDFYWSMKTYRSAVGGAGTTMLLSPDSEFFRFFRDSSGVPATPAPAN